MSNLLEVRHLKKYFPAQDVFGGSVKAVDDVSFCIEKGETLGLVGESGSGKSTLGRTLLRLIPADEGEILFESASVTNVKGSALNALRKQMQIVFQDPYSSLNPRRTVRQTLEEPLIIHETNVGKAERLERVREMLALVGLDDAHLDRFPHQFSGGQRQRIGIARALMLKPKFILCDEPVSALDVSVQSQIINLLCSLQERFSLTYLFIAHGLNVVKYVSDRVAVMYLGKLVEIGDAQDIYDAPCHPYTKALMSAIATHDHSGPQKRILLSGEIPSPIHPPAGCRFCTRCPNVFARCTQEEPLLREVAPGHMTACHLFDDVQECPRLQKTDANDSRNEVPL